MNHPPLSTSSLAVASKRPERPSELNHARADSSAGQTVRPTKGKQPSSAYADEPSLYSHCTTPAGKRQHMSAYASRYHARPVFSRVFFSCTKSREISRSRSAEILTFRLMPFCKTGMDARRHQCKVHFSVRRPTFSKACPFLYCNVN